MALPRESNPCFSLERSRFNAFWRPCWFGNHYESSIDSPFQSFVVRHIRGAVTNKAARAGLIWKNLQSLGVYGSVELRLCPGAAVLAFA